MLGNTYQLRLVIKFLRDNRIAYSYCSANIGSMLYEHGCHIKINDTYRLSVQTHPMIAGESFAETALQNMITRDVVYDGTHGYYDVQRFCNPSDLFEHILSLNPPRKDAIEGDSSSDSDIDEGPNSEKCN